MRELSSYILYYNADRLHSSLDTSPQPNSKPNTPSKNKTLDCPGNLKHPIQSVAVHVAGRTLLLVAKRV
jgi:hypothetical protein